MFDSVRSAGRAVMDHASGPKEDEDGQSAKPGYLGFKVIGILKLVSGVMALAVGIGVFRFLGHDPGPAAERLVTHLGLDPHNQIIHEVLSRITGIDRDHLRLLEAGTFFYALLHTIEGIGLILERDWAGYLVIVATSSLIPFEIYEIARKFTWPQGRDSSS